MCGIFAYCGNFSQASAFKHIFDGLKKLEYRGYDSWGIATLHNSKIGVVKKVGKMQKQPSSLDGCFGIGHTRWATHGGVTQVNAHPHYSTNEDFALVHNGIVENFEKLRATLVKKGYTFTSETDTEVIVRLIEDELKVTSDLISAVRKAFCRLEGRNTIAVLATNGKIIGVRNGSPLILGVSKADKQATALYLSSDTYSFANAVDQIHVLENNQMVVLDNGSYALLSAVDGSALLVNLENLDFTNKTAMLGRFRHYMEKEIMDTPESLLALTKISDSKYKELTDVIKTSRNVYILGSGTAGNAAFQMAYYLRKVAKINAQGLIGSDSNAYFDLFNDKDLIIALSQSGETADVLEVLEIAKTRGVKIASLVNMPGSMITRMSDIKFMADAGPEICVMSTKVFTSQIAWGYLVAKSIATSVKEAKTDIKSLAGATQSLLSDEKWLNVLNKLAKNLGSQKDIFILGKSGDTNIAREAMVKIIEGSYIHAHALPSGDLKHYAITLFEPGVSVLFIVPTGDSQKDVLSSVSQSKTRGVTCTAISPENNALFDNWIKVPDLNEMTSIISMIPLQFLAYYMADYLGNDVDKPRNIAKSVTVK